MNVKFQKLVKKVKNSWSKKIWFNKKLGQKNVWCKKEWSKTILDENKFLVQKNFMSKEMLGLKNLDKAISHPITLSPSSD